jgi:hypothetical protein
LTVRIQTLRAGFVALGLAAGAAACDNAGSALEVGTEDTGLVQVFVYLDRDGSGTISALDTAYSGAKIRLLPPAGTASLQTITSPTDGNVRFQDVAFGQYRVGIDTASIGDSLRVAAIDSGSVQITFVVPARVAIIRLAYPEATIAQARSMPVGQRVFLRGLLTSFAQAYRDGSVHLSDATGYLRLTHVTFLGGGTGNNLGDSVTVLARTASENGQPTADQARVARLAAHAAPIPIALTTAAAATANGGVLDAALVQLTAVVVADSGASGVDFRVGVNDGSGPVNLILDANLPFPRSIFPPGRSLTVKGVLVPNGAGGWSVKPRDTSDMIFNN